MTKIKSLQGLEILDSRGTPTVEVILETENGVIARSKVPSGASTGEHEAVELRDKDPARYFSKGVMHAVENVNGPLQKLLVGKSVFDQEALDKEMIEADGTENKSTFGANAILGASMAIARAAAKEKKMPLYSYLSDGKAEILPCPMMNIINGGAHADSSLDIQEFMIRPVGAKTFSEALRMGAEVFYSLKNLLKGKGFATSVGDEGGFAPQFSSDQEALETILLAIQKTGYTPKEQITIALDLAASEFYDRDEKCYYEKKKKEAGKSFAKRSTDEQIDYVIDLIHRYPIDSVEDALDENDWEGFTSLTKKIGKEIQIVGDDLLVTNPKFLEKAIDQKAANAILIKLNQIGTLTETLQAISLAKKNDWASVISHRSGETEDSFIADLAVATGSGQIKTGSLSRSDRIAKYNRLLEIELELGKKARYRK